MATATQGNGMREFGALSTRSERLLARLGVREPRDLSAWRSRELSALPGVGAGTVRELRRALHAAGEDFADAPERAPVGKFLHVREFRLVPVDSLELTERVRSKLASEGIASTGDLVCRHAEGLLESGLGHQDISEVRDALGQFGLCLGAGPLAEGQFVRAADLPVSEVGFSVRAQSALRGLRARRLGDLAGLARGRVARAKGVGPRVIDEIEALLRIHGLDFGGVGLDSGVSEVSLLRRLDVSLVPEGFLKMADRVGVKTLADACKLSRMEFDALAARDDVEATRRSLASLRLPDGDMLAWWDSSAAADGRSPSRAVRAMRENWFKEGVIALAASASGEAGALEDEILARMTALNADETAVAVVCAALGGERAAPRSYAEAGRAVGYSREGARLVCAEWSERLRARSAPPGRLLRASAAARGLAVPSSAFARRLEAASGVRVEYSALRAHCEFFGVEPPALVPLPSTGELVVGADVARPRDAAAFIGEIARVGEETGIVDVQDAGGPAGLAIETRSRLADESELFVRAGSGTRRIHVGWAERRVAPKLRKVLSVVPSVEVSELAALLSNPDRHGERVTLGADIVGYVAEATGVSAFDGRTVRRTGDIARESALSAAELAVVRALEASEGEGTLKDVRAACREAGISQTAAYWAVAAGPLAHKIGRGRYRLCGGAGA